MDFFCSCHSFFHDDYQDIYYLLIANMYCFFPQPYLFRNKTGWCWVQIARYKKIAKEWEIKVKAFRKRLDDIQTKLAKHMDQYVQMHHRRQAGGKHWKHQFDSIRFDPERLAQGIS